MRWFEHRTDAGSNKKIRKIEVFYKEHGGQAVMAAVGRFWRLMEIVGQQGQGEDGLDSFSLPDDYGLDVLADDLWCTVEELREFLDLLAEINSIDADLWRNEEKIYAPKLAERADRYTKKLNRIKIDIHEGAHSVRTVCAQDAMSVYTKSDKKQKCTAPQSQTQTQETTPPTPPPGGNGAGDFLRWFEAYPEKRRKDRLKAEKEWRRLQRHGRLPPMREMLEVLGRQARSEEWNREEGRFIPLPHRYLSLGRFVDASVSTAREPPGKCGECKGSGFRRARPGEEALGGQVRCECKSDQEAQGP
jgi:hypothetical protein